jgi:pimeloyl-ACP methyl ester carboxylesterase
MGHIQYWEEGMTYSYPKSAIKLNKNEGAKPWKKDFHTIYNELVGCQIRTIKGKKYVTRVIEYDGGGEPLILIHGTGGSGESWFRNIRNLGRKHGFHVYAIDAMYHGFSSKEPVTDDRIGMQVEHLLDFMDAEGLAKANVEGESMGSFISLRLGLEHPDRCLKLVLNTGAAVNFKREFKPSLQPPEALRVLTQELLDSPSEETVRHRMEWLMASPDRVDDELVSLRLQFFSMQELQQAQRQTGASNTQAQVRRVEEEALKDMKVPCLVFWSEFNPGGGPDIGEHFASLIPGAKFYNMLDAAHWPQYEHAEEHDQVVADFLKGK